MEYSFHRLLTILGSLENINSASVIHLLQKESLCHCPKGFVKDVFDGVPESIEIESSHFSLTKLLGEI